jgi:hypothetical protein
MYEKYNIALQHGYSTQGVYSTYLLHDFNGTVYCRVNDPVASMEMDIGVIGDCESNWQ